MKKLWLLLLVLALTLSLVWCSTEEEKTINPEVTIDIVSMKPEVVMDVYVK